MDGVSIIVLIASIVTAIMLVVVVPMAVKYFKSNNIPVEDIMNSSKQIAKILEGLVNNIGLDANTKGILNTILSTAQTAVRYAEQLYVSGQLDKDLRKEKAVEFVKQALTDAGIQDIEKYNLLINAAIESAVFLLPKTNETLRLKGAKQTLNKKYLDGKESK